MLNLDLVSFVSVHCKGERLVGLGYAAFPSATTDSHSFSSGSSAPKPAGPQGQFSQPSSSASTCRLQVPPEDIEFVEMKIKPGSNIPSHLWSSCFWPTEQPMYSHAVVHTNI